MYVSGQIHALATLSYVKEIPLSIPLECKLGGGVSCQSRTFEKRKSFTLTANLMANLSYSSKT